MSFSHSWTVALALALAWAGCCWPFRSSLPKPTRLSTAPAIDPTKLATLGMRGPPSPNHPPAWPEHCCSCRLGRLRCGFCAAPSGVKVQPVGVPRPSLLRPTSRLYHERQQPTVVGRNLQGQSLHGRYDGRRDSMAVLGAGAGGKRAGAGIETTPNAGDVARRVVTAPDDRCLSLAESVISQSTF